MWQGFLLENNLFNTRFREILTAPNTAPLAKVTWPPVTPIAAADQHKPAVKPRRWLTNTSVAAV